MNFSKALKALKKGKLVCREAWSLDNYLFLVSNETISFNNENKLSIPSNIYMNIDYNWDSNQRWLPYQEDILATDWIEVELES